MDESVIFRDNLLRLMHEKGMSAAELSRRADMNARAVKDIEEGRAISPRLSTVFKFAKALGVDPGELVGLGARHHLNERLAAYLSRYDECEQEQILTALLSLPAPAK